MAMLNNQMVHGFTPTSLDKKNNFNGNKARQRQNNEVKIDKMQVHICPSASNSYGLIFIRSSFRQKHISIYLIYEKHAKKSKQMNTIQHSTDMSCRSSWCYESGC